MPSILRAWRFPQGPGQPRQPIVIPLSRRMARFYFAEASSFDHYGHTKNPGPGAISDQKSESATSSYVSLLTTYNKLNSRCVGFTTVLIVGLPLQPPPGYENHRPSAPKAALVAGACCKRAVACIVCYLQVRIG